MASLSGANKEVMILLIELHLKVLEVIKELIAEMRASSSKENNNHPFVRVHWHHAKYAPLIARWQDEMGTWFPKPS